MIMVAMLDLKSKAVVVQIEEITALVRRAMTPVELRSSYVPHDPVNVDTGQVSMTRQEFAEECDINVMMARYERTGIMPGSDDDGESRYFDVTGIPDYRESLDIIQRAGEAFMLLPAKVRREFENDPAEFCDFALDPANLDKMREWGLAPPAAPGGAPPIEPPPPRDAPPAPPPEPPKK